MYKPPSVIVEIPEIEAVAPLSTLVNVGLVELRGPRDAFGLM
jgi:hypothetical protein